MVPIIDNLNEREGRSQQLLKQRSPPHPQKIRSHSPPQPPKYVHEVSLKENRTLQPLQPTKKLQIKKIAPHSLFQGDRQVQLLSMS